MEGFVMGMTRAGMNRFRDRVDEVLRELLPVTLIIDGVRIVAASPGGRASSGFEMAGEDPDLRITFRVPKADLENRLEIGDAVTWELDDGTQLAMEVSDRPYRPEESVWILTCKHRRS